MTTVPNNEHRAGALKRWLPEWLTFDDLWAVVVACVDLVALVGLFVLVQDPQWWTWALAGVLLANGIALVGWRGLGELIIALTAFASIGAIVASPVLLILVVLGWL